MHQEMHHAAPRCSGPPDAADRAKAAEALIANGATVDKVDDKGRTALCHAAKYGSIDCIHILGHHNANAFHEDNEGNNPLQIAEDASRFEATNHIRKLQQVGPNLPVYAGQHGTQACCHPVQPCNSCHHQSCIGVAPQGGLMHLRRGSDVTTPPFILLSLSAAAALAGDAAAAQG